MKINFNVNNLEAKIVPWTNKQLMAAYSRLYMKAALTTKKHVDVEFIKEGLDIISQGYSPISVLGKNRASEWYKKGYILKEDIIFNKERYKHLDKARKKAVEASKKANKSRAYNADKKNAVIEMLKGGNSAYMASKEAGCTYSYACYVARGYKAELAKAEEEAKAKNAKKSYQKLSIGDKVECVMSIRAGEMTVKQAATHYNTSSQLIYYWLKTI